MQSTTPGSAPAESSTSSSRWSGNKSLGYAVRIVADCALPDADHVPTGLLREGRRARVPLGVAPHLILPERGIRTGPRSLAAVLGTTVPEASVHEDGKAAPRHHKVGCAALCDLAMQTEPGTGRMEGPPKLNLGSCVDLLPSRQVSARGRADPAFGHDPTLAGGFHWLDGGDTSSGDDRPGGVPVALHRYVRTYG